MTDILAAQSWASNAELIADVAALGYLPGTVLDATYGRGTWWKRWRPERLVTSDLVTAAAVRSDFRYLPFPNASFDAVAYDPPYVCVGGRKTTTLPDFHDRYGLTDAPKSPQELQVLINDGLSECKRVVKADGFIIVKCQDYVSSGRLWCGVYETQYWAQGYERLHLVDRFEHVGRSRPQPGGRRQVHARRNVSTLLVFRKPGR